MDPLIRDLQKILPKERVKTRLIDVISYASDAGFYQLIPKVVVQPVGTEEVQQIFSLSHQHNCPLVFRSGGTSLSGQCITDGILVDLSKHWKKISVSENGKKVTVQPGITGGMVNLYLKKYATKIGPDPASINAAMMGGILSNNSSGMCCGVVNNSYHTMKSICFVLPDGKKYDSSNQEDYLRFENEQPGIFQKMNSLKEQIASNKILHERIRKKYRTKNTVGYGLNALVDYSHPFDIFSHLLIGAEGTLGFIAEGTLMTIPDKPFKATAMLYFSSIHEACDAIIQLKDSGAEALELMDRASLRSVEHLPGLPGFFQALAPTAAAILCEYQTESQEELDQKLSEFKKFSDTLRLLHEASFTTDENIRNFYWKIRKGMFPSVGAVRQRGSTVILEDIAVPVEKLADACHDLQNLFKEFNYDNAIIFGHAKDGNIHFVITQLLDTPEEIDRYDKFLRKVVVLVVEKFDGALKAEHGTGRNMAPFVEAEWGGEAYRIMQEIKAVADPRNLLNPGVIINKSGNAHLENLKEMPVVEEEVDKCIECGFCEHNCPSRDLTTSPRRRIVVRRALQQLQKAGKRKQVKKLLKEYQYYGLETCATDGLCASDCPVDINTGDLVKRLRNEKHGRFSNAMARRISGNYKAVESMVRFWIRVFAGIDKWFKWRLIHRMSKFFHRIFPGLPVWISSVGNPPKKISNQPQKPELVYFTSCINHLMSSHGKGKPSLQETFLSLCRKAGLEVMLPPNISGHCCGQPFSSKGYNEAATAIACKTIDALLEWTQNGALPVVIDFTSCTYTFIHNKSMLPSEYKEKFSRLRLIDSIQCLDEMILPRLQIRNKKETIAIHPVCSATKLNLVPAFEKIASACSARVIKPVYAGCCGMAGDRGFFVPELISSATGLELNELKGQACDGYYSSSTTCEIALTENSGKRYEHIIYLLDEVSEP